MEQLKPKEQHKESEQQEKRDISEDSEHERLKNFGLSEGRLCWLV